MAFTLLFLNFALEDLQVSSLLCLGGQWHGLLKAVTSVTWTLPSSWLILESKKWILQFSVYISIFVAGMWEKLETFFKKNIYKLQIIYEKCFFVCFAFQVLCMEPRPCAR